MSQVRHKVRTAVALLLGMVLMSGCDFDVYSLPLPGGADTGEDPITVHVEFADVLDLVPKSSVKVNDVTVGEVTQVERQGYHAVVTLEVRRDVELPDNTTASIRQTSLLGEKFVSLAAPEAPSAGQLEDGDRILLADTGRSPEVEEVLGALSLVLNGGGVAQMKTIAAELNKALEGREDSAKSVFRQIESFMSQLDSRKADIVAAIESLNRLAITARRHQSSIDLALEEMPSALDSLERQREDLVAMLRGLSRLGDVGVRVINATRASTVSSLKSLFPVLNQIAAAGDDFVDGFSTFLTYPFVDESVGRDPEGARRLDMGDYVNLSVDLDLNLARTTLPQAACIGVNQLPDSPLDQLIKIKNLCNGAEETLQNCLKTPPNQAACARLPQYLLDNVCSAVDLFCAISGGGRGGSSQGLPTDPITDLLKGALGGGGLGRPAPGATEAQNRMWTAFDATYDVDLVGLYAGPLVESGAREGVQR